MPLITPHLPVQAAAWTALPQECWRPPSSGDGLPYLNRRLTTLDAPLPVLHHRAPDTQPSWLFQPGRRTPRTGWSSTIDTLDTEMNRRSPRKVFWAAQPDDHIDVVPVWSPNEAGSRGPQPCLTTSRWPRAKGAGRPMLGQRPTLT